MRGRIIPWVSGLGIALLETACIGTRPPGPPTTQELRIQLDASACPVRVTPPPTADCVRGMRDGACVAKGDKLTWAAPRPFRVYFDPREGQRIASACDSGECKTPAFAIDETAPPAKDDRLAQIAYKYTVAVDGCPRPLDPPIFIQR